MNIFSLLTEEKNGKFSQNGEFSQKVKLGNSRTK